MAIKQIGSLKLVLSTALSKQSGVGEMKIKIHPISPTRPHCHYKAKNTVQVAGNLSI